jgi:uncharacterized protein
MFDPAMLMLLFAAGLAGGAMNALAGGGTFATMPALIAAGLPSPIANATSIVALQPGAMASAWGFRDGLAPLGGVGVRTLGLVTFAGGAVGALMLVATPTRAFDLVVPWLLLIATLALALGPGAAHFLARHAAPGRGALIAMQALLGVYGGYFGGGIGMMLTAAYGLLAGAAPHRVMGQRTLMLAIANAAATILFVALAMVRWDAAIPMLGGAVLGGWLGARIGRIASPGLVRAVTLIVAIGTTIVFFARAYR